MNFQLAQQGLSNINDIQSQNLLFEQFMDNSPLLAWITDATGDMLYVNNTFKILFHLTDDCCGKNVSELFPPELANEYHQNNLRVLEGGKPFEQLERVVLPGGAFRMYKTHKFPVQIQGTTAVAGWGIDVTELTNLRMELIESVERYSLIQKAVSDAVYDWSTGSAEVYLGEKARRIFGATSKSQNVRKLLRLIHPEDVNKVFEVYCETIKDQMRSTWEIEYRVLCADGLYRYFVDKGFVLRFGTNVLRIVGALRDVSAQKKMHEELINQEKSLKKKMVRSMIEGQELERRNLSVELHDNVNQILASCKLMLDIAGDGGENTEMLLKKSARSINEVISEIRRISHDLNPSAMMDVGFAEGVRELVERINLTGTAHVQFNCNLEESFISSSGQDDIAVFRIIQEQLNNILKHAKAKNIRIDIHVADKRVDLCIVDDGTGMDIGKVKKGLGLRNIQNRVDYYNGTLHISSAAGRGTELRVILYLESAPISKELFALTKQRPGG